MRQKKLLCLLIANLFAGAGPVLAQSGDFVVGGSVTAGGIYVDEDARDPYKLNEYRDLDSGALLGFDVRGRGSRYWFDLFGENLGRDDQYLNARGGMYDVFKYRVYSDSLRHNFLMNGITPYAGAGSNAHRATFPRLDPTVWNGTESSYKRRDDGGFFEFQGVSPWYARIDANQVSWKGSKPGSASQGLSPGNGFVELQFPVDYTTRNVSVEGGYNSRTVRFDVSYLISKFENSEEIVTWTNGYWGNGVDTTFLAADNRYERIAGNFSWRGLFAGSTLAARFTLDELSSNTPLPSSVLGSTTGGMVATGPSAPSFDGNVENQTFTVSFTSAPMRAIDTKVYYNYRKRDDTSTHVSFTPAAVDNHQYSYETNNWGFDAYWRFARGHRLGFGYDYNDTEREGRWDFDRTKDKRLFVEYKAGFHDDFSGRIKYTHLERDSNFLLGNSGTSPNDSAYLNRSVTAFDLSNVKQDQWKLMLDWTPAPNFDVGFEAILKKNDFEQNTLGRISDDRREVYLSASYGLPGGIRFTAFGDAEQVEYDSVHRVIGSGGIAGAYSPATAPNSQNYNWSGRVEEENWAAGFAIDFPVAKNFTIKASAIYYKTDGMVDLALQQGVPASVTSPVPVQYFDDTKRTSLTVKGVWDFSKSLTFTAGYAYEKYEYSDEQYNGYRNTIPGSSGQDSYLNNTYAYPHYKAHIVYGTLSYRF